MVRKTVFWAHLVAGFVAGVFILLMAGTGTLLTYEQQIETWAKSQAIEVPAEAQPLDVDELIDATLAAPGQTLTVPRSVGDLVTLSSGRQSMAIDPYTGNVLEGAGEEVATFFHGVGSLHRWLSVSGRNEIGSFAIDASNLIFLFIVVSGLVLWLPKTWRWTKLKTQLLFRRGLPNAQARDYNWHHVFGFWALVPLFVIVLTGVIMSYGWANTALFTLVGEEVPEGRPRGAALINGQMQRATLDGAPLSYAELVARAAAERSDWVRVSVELPADNAAYMQITMDAGNGQEPGKRTTVVLDRSTGEVVTTQTGATGRLGMRLRMWARFAHTGQYYGLVGQTVAGLASLAAMVLVWTGIALGLRRLSRMWRRRRSAMA